MLIKRFLSLGLLLMSVAWLVPLQAAERVYIMAGQSNMMGRGGQVAELPAHYRRMPSNVRFFYQGRERDLAQSTYFGPEVSFAHQVARTFPHDEHLIIKHVATGSSVQQWQPGGALYEGLLRLVGYTRTDKNSVMPNIDAIFWMQGEADAMNLSRAQQYTPRLTRMIKRLRQDLAARNSLFIMGRVNSETPKFPGVSAVQRSQQQLAQILPNTLLVSSDGLDKIFDDIHYSSAGLVELGERFAERYIRHTQTPENTTLQANHKTDASTEPAAQAPPLANANRPLNQPLPANFEDYIVLPGMP